MTLSDTARRLLASTALAMTLVPVVTAAHEATPTTAAANLAVLDELDFSDRRDFDAATRGFIAAMEDPVILNAAGKPAWDTSRYDFLEGEAPNTVNPSLWRQGQLNQIHGLFEVTDGIYQLRGYDLSNMTLVRGDTGWIVIDPLLTPATARASLELAKKHLGDLPVVAVIYTHSHADHFGGARGVIDMEAYARGEIEVIAPDGFMEHAVAENIMAGNAMTRRASFMYGNILEKGPEGQVGTGLGQTTSTDAVSLVPPTRIISETGDTIIVDGIEIEFQMANGSEAPSEFMFYFPQKRALCLSEVTSHVMHNIYTLRGAQMRNALDWSKYINETIELFDGRVDVAFASHHWPTFGQDNVREFLVKQRDVYRFIHDETLRLANAGYTPREIANMIEMPAELSKNFATRGYYGTLKHNAEAVYNFYLGWFDGNPANLDRHTPVESGKRYVEFIGGADVLLEKAQAAYDAGDYRWVAEVVNHLVFADPENAEARELQAAALTQLGYQAESGPWRNFYLTAATELRNGIKPSLAPYMGPDALQAMTLDMVFDFLGVRLNPEKAAGQTLAINMHFTDTDEHYALELGNSVLNNTKGKILPNADVSFQLTRQALGALMLKKMTFPELLQAKMITFEGNPQAFGQLTAMLDEFDLWFPIVTPKQM